MKKHSTTVGDLVADLYAKYQSDFHNDAIAATVTSDVVNELRRFSPSNLGAVAVRPPLAVRRASARRNYVTA